MQSVASLAAELNQPDFSQLIRRFLHDQLYAETESSGDHPTLPNFRLGRVSVYSSAVSTFYAPSDLSGVSGKRRERIRATLSWKKGPPRYDCIFVSTDPAVNGFLGLDVARIHLFFSINF